MVNDDFKQQAFLRFADITQKKIENAQVNNEELEEKKDRPVSRDEMQSKIATARIHANKEIDQFRNAAEEFIEKVEGLCLFDGVDSIIRELFINQLLDSIVSPTVRGQRIPGMPEEHYRRFRTDLYKTLIATYIDKK